MKDLTKYFIDLSKCSEEQQKHIEKLTNYKYRDNFYSCLYFTGFQWMGCTSCHVLNNGKTELIYPEFIKLFEGGADNNGWIKIESKSQYDLLENGEYHWYNINTGRYDKGDLWEFGTFTHYQPISKPLPPKF